MLETIPTIYERRLKETFLRVMLLSMAGLCSSHSSCQHSRYTLSATVSHSYLH
jgi:hypothetical protein